MLAMNRDPMVLGSIVSNLAELFLSATCTAGVETQETWWVLLGHA